ncbi:MAG: thymidine phosphorylase [Gemmatimonadota bacterium]
MLISELIERTRDGGELHPDELRALLDAYRDGTMPDYQMAAWLMAVFFRGLTAAELSALTRAIIDSGERLDFRTGGAPAVDKHSTGGVGDKVSLVLAPLLAELGLRVPMMSGRGLGHTGGTLDKLESIPGFRTDLDLAEFRAVLDDVGCAMIGQTPQIAPLDGRLYALRDVTGTVQSIPLIASSIVSKKVAEGIEALVLDVKVGRGAFMVEEEDAIDLARALVGLAGEEGLAASALLTSMDEPLGQAVGNALEVAEAVACLRGEGPADLRAVTLALCAELVVGAGLEPDEASALAALERVLDGGAALDRFARLVERQGGDPCVAESGDRLPKADVTLPWTAPSGGTVTAVDARKIGLAAVELGAGRARMEDVVDPTVGFEVTCSVGDEVSAGDPLAVIHAASRPAAERAAERLADAIRIEAGPRGARAPLLRYRVTPDGVTALS